MWSPPLAIIQAIPSLNTASKVQEPFLSLTAKSVLTIKACPFLLLITMLLPPNFAVWVLLAITVKIFSRVPHKNSVGKSSHSLNGSWVSGIRGGLGAGTSGKFCVSCCANVALDSANNNVNVVSGIPNIEMTCNGHTILFKPFGAPCLSNEYGVFVDGVNFLCVVADDTYLFPLTNTINAICGGSSIVINP